MDLNLPPKSLKLRRIANHLSQLSLELIEPIIADLPLHKLLDLLSIPVRDESQTEEDITELSPLAHATIISPTWKPIFKSTEQTERLVRAWQALNCISWMCRREPYVEAFLGKYDRCYHPLKILLYRSSQLKRYPVLEQMEHVLLHSVPGFHVSNEKGRAMGSILLYSSYLKALYRFLPPRFGTLLGVSQFNGVTTDDVPRAADDTLSNKRFDIFEEKQWDVAMSLQLVPELSKASKRLTEVWIEEVHSLITLYERFPTLLKAPLAPQMSYTPMNLQHIPDNLRSFAKKLATRDYGIGMSLDVNSKYKPSVPYPFRFLHPYLIPYNWCLRLFVSVLKEEKPSFPPELAGHANRAVKGLSYLCEHEGGSEEYPRFEGSEDDPRHMQFIVYEDDEKVLPTPIGEMEWLTSFLTVVNWMKDHYPNLAKELRRPLARLYRTRKGKGQKRLLLEPSDYKYFVDAIPADEVAKYLKRDSQLCGDLNNVDQPSLLAFHLPKFSLPAGRSIAKYLGPEEDLPIEVQQFVYENIIEKIKAHFAQTPTPERSLDGQFLAHESQDQGEGEPDDGGARPTTTWIKL